MKKSNVTFIAAALIAIHVLVFIAFIGTKEDKKSNKLRPPKTKPAQTRTTTPKPVPKLTTPEVAMPAAAPLAPMPEPVVMPIEIVEMKPVTPSETIASTRNSAGYLRSDRPNKRTSQVFAELKNDPYQSAIVVDARTGKILYENRSAVYSYPASVTKMMTMLLTLEQIDAGNIALTDKVAITKEGVHMRNSRPSQIYLDTRESGLFTVEDMLNAVMIHSACDASQVLGIHIAGSRKAFIDMMNQKARELGMNSTIYNTEHGLPPIDGQPDISTAYDIAILSLACLRHPETLKYTGTNLAYLPANSVRKEKMMLANRNHLISRKPYPGCDGLKTGYHSKGGFSLAATAKQGNDRVVAVVLGCEDRNVREAEIRKLLNKGFAAVK